MKLKKSTPLFMIGLMFGIWKCVMDQNKFGVFLIAALIACLIVLPYFIWNDM